MKHKKGERIIISETETSKIISDHEIICNTEIYYMSDNTSYALSQINSFNYSECEILNVINSNKNNVISLFDTKKMAENCVIYMEKNKPKSKYLPSLLLNLFPKVSRLWTSTG